mmetsp:Transcript_135102/g.337063  ORF Transcript_135102/g.337063 Transcript_135102/m.337063 type:complete len:266 (-) Transcript_135102:992-1789(-)
MATCARARTFSTSDVFPDLPLLSFMIFWSFPLLSALTMVAFARSRTLSTSDVFPALPFLSSMIFSSFPLRSACIMVAFARSRTLSTSEDVWPPDKSFSRFPLRSASNKVPAARSRRASAACRSLAANLASSVAIRAAILARSWSSLKTSAGRAGRSVSSSLASTLQRTLPTAISPVTTSAMPSMAAISLHTRVRIEDSGASSFACASCHVVPGGSLALASTMTDPSRRVRSISASLIVLPKSAIMDFLTEASRLATRLLFFINFA